jgi:uncharacterized protein (DUF58 family)
MLTREQLRAVRKIQIRTKHLVSDVFAGQYHSAFKGQGMEFAEVRPYLPGDDVRSIDWNVTARTGEPHIKRFTEERELTVMLLVDASASVAFGTSKRMKRELAAEIGALFAFSAITNNDRVGLVVFTDEVELAVHPRKGTTHVLRVIREILSHRPQNTGTDIAGALDYLTRIVHRKAVVLVISDFLQPGLERPLAVVGKKHDLICIALDDPRDDELPEIGLLRLEDPESGETTVVDTSDPQVRREFANRRGEARAARDTMFRAAGADHVALQTDRDYARPLYRLFQNRERRK